MQVTLIPYWFNSGSTQLDLTPNVSLVKTVSDKDETNVKTNTAGNKEDITYNINVTNIGGRTTNVSVIDDYDQSYLTITDANGGTNNGDTITWSIPTLEHGQTNTYTVKAKIKDLAQGNYQFINKAWTINPNTPEDKTTTNVNAKAIIALNKTVTDSDETKVKVDTVQGDHYNDNERKLTFNISYSNNGDADATNVVLTDDLSQFVSDGVFKSVDNISNGGTYDSNTHIITWNIGTLADGDSGTVNFELNLNRIASGDKSVVNTSTITSNENQPIVSTTTTNIITPNLTISKTDGKVTANTGDTLTYTITVNNVGNGNAYNLSLTDTLPDYVQDVRNISNNGVYNASNRTITWTNTTDPQGIELDSKKVLTLTLEVTVPSIMPLGTTTLTNVVSVVSPTIPEKKADDKTDVTAMPKLEIVKYVKNLTAIENNRPFTGNNGSYGADANTWLNNDQDVRAIAGDVLEFTLTYRNTGNATSPTTFVVDHLPRYIQDINGNPFEIVRLEDFVSLESGLTPVPNNGSWDIVWNQGDLPVSNDFIVKKFPDSF